MTLELVQLRGFKNEAWLARRFQSSGYVVQIYEQVLTVRLTEAMANIVHYFPISALASRVFEAISTPEGLNTWWTKRSAGEPREGGEYELYFSDDDDWRAVVSCCVPPTEFELQLTDAHEDWRGTRVGFVLEEHDGITQVRFHHSDWPEANDHYQVSCYCWAMYLRLLKQHVECGKFVPYEERLNA